MLQFLIPISIKKTNNGETAMTSCYSFVGETNFNLISLLHYKLFCTLLGLNMQKNVQLVLFYLSHQPRMANDSLANSGQRRQWLKEMCGTVLRRLKCVITDLKKEVFHSKSTYSSSLCGSQFLRTFARGLSTNWILTKLLNNAFGSLLSQNRQKASNPFCDSGIICQSRTMSI